MKNTVIGWIAPILVIVGLACVTPAPLRAGDDLLLGGGEKRAGGKVMGDSASLSPEETPYGKSVLAASGDSALDAPSDSTSKDSASGDKGSDSSSAASGDDSAPKDEEEKPKKKKKKSWWPFGHKNDDESSSKKESRKKKSDEEKEPSKESALDTPPSPSADEAAGPASGDKTAAGPSEPDKASSDRRLKDLKESLPPDITDRATRGESHIKELLDRARAIKARQAERETQAADESRQEDQRRREAEQEEARQREMALKTPDEPVAPADDDLTGKKSKLSKGTKDKIKALQTKREELFAEGAPQERIDKLDSQIAALKKSGKGSTKTADAGTASKKGKSKKSKSTETTGKKKKKKKSSEDLVAPSLPADASPEPLTTADADTTPKKKKKSGKKKKSETGDTAAAPPPADGNEFKLDTGTPASN